ncbi:MAG: MMPL family transporter [Bacillota bacterium]|nr:MMPL family transporter [Bacillota bacterium]
MDRILRKAYIWVVNHPRMIVTVFAAALLICVVLKGMVSVNYDMKDYLPEDSPSTRALHVMDNEYDEGTPNVRVMIKDVSIPEALDYKQKLEDIDGVTQVTWLDDSVNIGIPLEMMDEDLTDNFYKDGNVLYQVTVDKSKRISAVHNIEILKGAEIAASGDAVSTVVATLSTVKEIKKITIIAVIFVLLILVVTTRSWIEPVIILAGLGVSIGINAGTNIIFGEISFITNAAGSILQLAVSLDYSVFLIHRYEECRKTCSDHKEAMVDALSKSTSSILSSGTTTVIGFLALILMQFRIGPDLGIALAKGILIGLITVFSFTPALVVLCHRIMEKAHHRSFLPDFRDFGKFVYKAMIPMVCIFALIIVPAYKASNSNSYYYGSAYIFGTDTKLGRDTEEIKEKFCKNDTYALMIPKGKPSVEKELSQELQELPEVSGIISYVDAAGAEVPKEYVEADTLKKLDSDKYTRMIISVDVEDESEETFRLVETIRDIADEYYPDEWLLAGSGVSNYDLMDTTTADMIKVNLVAIVAVYLVLVLMMRSLFLPLILVASIETAIWINVSCPYIIGNPVFYIAYLIISSVQLGATVDYSILMTDRYREYRETLDKKEAVVSTISSVTGSILVSGSALTMVGFLLGFISSHGVLAQLGIFVGRGALCSLCIVFLVLPGMLYIFDRLYIRKPGGRKKSTGKKMTLRRSKENGI